MSLHESSPLDRAIVHEDGSGPSLIDEVRIVVSVVMQVEDVSELRDPKNYGLVFTGTLQVDPDDAFARLSVLLEPLGFTPFLQHERGQDVVLAVQGLALEADADKGGGPMRRLMRASGRSPWWLHLMLLLATIGTTIYAGALLLDGGVNMTLAELLAAGAPFAVTLLLILGVHEMGHYVAARRHRVQVTLPFFIPLPIPGSLGTMGAVIFIRSALKNRKSLFDVGISGPLAGLALAIPLFVIGLLLPPIEFGAPITISLRGVGVPLLLQGLGSLVTDGNLGRLILVHPVALAAWFGVLLTALNLLPLGQFDGGHVAYALLGRRAWPLAGAVFVGLIMAGISFWMTWTFWAFLAMMSGLRHPPPHNDITPLDIRRRMLGWFTVLIFVLIVVPQPLVTRQPLFRGLNQEPAPMPTMRPMDFVTPTPFALGQ